MRFPLLPTVFALALISPPVALPQDAVTLIAPGGIRAAMERLIPGFERDTGYKVKATYPSGLDTKKRVAAGEVFDVAIIQPPYPEVLASGHIVANSSTPLATVAVGVAVKRGASKPDVSTPDAVKRTLLAAKSVSYPDPAGGAAAGVIFEAMLKTLGIREQMEPALRPGQRGAGAMAMVANGEAEMGVTYLSEMEDPGLDVVGALPQEVAPRTGLVGFISTHARDPIAARLLLDYLGSPVAVAVYKAQRMEPGR